VRTHFPESQRDSVTQPKVAESARLPWDGRGIGRQPQRGCVIWRGNIRHNPLGLMIILIPLPRVARSSQPLG